MDAKVLDKVWDKGRGHLEFGRLVDELRETSGNLIRWSDDNGRLRTLASPSKRLRQSGPRETDATSDAKQLSRAILRRTSGIERGGVEVDGATCLALTCLARHDVTNFARVVAASPRAIITALLDGKKVEHGPLFTEEVIWPVIARTAVHIKDLGAASTRLAALTKAFDNFLAYHNPGELKEPYTTAIKWSYKDARKKTDVLANNSSEFQDCIERIWTTLSPPEAPLRDILTRGPTINELDAHLGAIIVNVVFSGVDAHLKGVMDRRTKAAKKVKNAMVIGAAAPTDVLKGAAGGADAGAASGIVGKISDILVDSAQAKISGIHKKENPSEMRITYAALFWSVISINSTAGRFAVSQQVLTNAQLRALLPTAASGEVFPRDKASSEGTSRSIREGWKERYVGKDEIAEEEFMQILKAREKLGNIFHRKSKEIVQQNSASPAEPAMTNVAVLPEA